MLVAERGDRRDPVTPGEVDRPLRGDSDGPLLELLLGESAGLSRQLNSQGSVKKLMLMTSIPTSPAYTIASTVACRKKNPESCPALMLTSVTLGATPAVQSR